MLKYVIPQLSDVSWLVVDSIMKNRKQYATWRVCLANILERRLSCGITLLKHFSADIRLLLHSTHIQYRYIRGVARGGKGARAPLRNLADQLTLFKPGGRLCPLHFCQPLRIQKAIYTSVHTYSFIQSEHEWMDVIIVSLFLVKNICNLSLSQLLALGLPRVIASREANDGIVPL